MTVDYFLPSYLRDSPLYKNNKRLYSSISLPTQWNAADCSSYITIVDDENLTVKYIGPGRNWVDAASIRANYSIPPEIGLYYYEMTVVNCGDRGCIGIGLSKPATRLNRMPGWEPDTIGYHGDDGNLYCERGTGVKFGPLYTTGETVGCGINFFDKFIFFTKNGVILGIELLFNFDGYPFGALNKSKIVGEMYPMCGMESPNESITVNFGAKPFKFNIDCYAKKIFERAEKRIEEEKQKAIKAAADSAANSIQNQAEVINTTNPIANPSNDEIINHNTNHDVAPDPETTSAINTVVEPHINVIDTNITDTLTSTPSDIGDVVSSNVSINSTPTTTL
ncbi:2247_t:CDS:2 [Dentiscutata heterogama]|uniref:2247_t:CDS:1 n=1 Tax=Dentiscutata heterogama TaxID=1316150 RepID=A0ACA9MS69_9GLOM|nr:2247_t:CDS:2 [Dentiscutata heterogama]